VSVIDSSRILMALLLSRKRCVLHAGRRRRFLVPTIGEDHAQVPIPLHLSPDRQPKTVCDVFVCTKASARLLVIRAHKGWARWGKTVQPVLITSSYSSLQGTNRYSEESVIQGPHGGVTFAGVLLTRWSQFHPLSISFTPSFSLSFDFTY
jgi:hypothetical protein